MLHRDYEETGAKHQVPAWTPLVLILLRVVLWPFPFVRRWMGATMSGRVGRVGRLEAAEKFREAFELALETIPLCLKPRGRMFFSRNPGASLDRMNGWYWWFFLGRAARCARKLGPEERRRVIDLLPSAPEPGGKEQAMLCDETFYAHRTGRLDPLPFLVDAVRADPEIRYHIESEFEGSPELLAALRNAVQPS